MYEKNMCFSDYKNSGFKLIHLAVAFYSTFMPPPTEKVHVTVLEEI